MDSLSVRIQQAAASVLVHFFRPTERTFWIYLLSSLAIAGLVWWRESGGRPRRPNDFVRFLFPRSIWRHSSALVDYTYFLVNSVVRVMVLLPAFALAEYWMHNAVDRLPWPSPLDLDGFGWTVLATFVEFVVIDLGLFIGHYLLHRNPLLWEFHKVHHSAEVLTPITFYRTHPVEDLFNGVLAGIMGGVASGLFAALSDGAVEPYHIAGVNILLVAFYFLGYNLRHSHVWLSYGKLDRLLVSPAMHQIHHSAEEPHWNRNMGLVFSFWDRWFGTLYLLKGKERFAMGLSKGEHRDYSGVMRLYFLPFAKCYRRNRSQPSSVRPT